MIRILIAFYYREYPSLLLRIKYGAIEQLFLFICLVVKLYFEKTIPK